MIKMSPALESTDAKNKLEDLSGVKFQPGENPYNALIKACGDGSVRVVGLIQSSQETLCVT